VPATWKTRLDAALMATADDLVALRRHLHMNPEPSGEEDETSLHLYQELTSRGLDVTMGPEGKGVFVDSPDAAKLEGVPRIAARADIDALRIQDEKDVPYRSRRPGLMHACGHDAHTAILFTTLACLHELAQAGELPHPVRWRGIFQPSEETATGASAMIAAGAMEGVDAALALHVDPTRPAGKIALRPGTMTAACDAVRLVIRGRGGHAARPHESNDPIAAAAQLVSTLYQFIPRRTNSQDAVVLSFGQIAGGQNPNVIPEEVTLRGTLRTLDRQVREKALADIRQIVRGIEEIAGVTVEIALEASTGSVYNDERLVDLVCATFDELYGRPQREAILRPSMGSEDFACFLEYAPGVLFRLGCAADPASAPGLHTPLFDVDENALVVGARVLAHTIVGYCTPSSQ
jgi:amidohydrolase